MKARARLCAAWIAALAVGACLPPAGPSTVVSNRGRTRRLPPSDVRVLSEEAAARTGLVGRRTSREFGEGQDGTRLVAELLEEARKQGADVVSGIAITLGASGPDGPMACRTEILPESVTETHSIPATTTIVPVSRPVSRTVTEYQYRCHLVSRPKTRLVTEYHQECRSVSHPVTRTRTTYSYQYDSFSKSSRSVPRTESYTTYESRQECRSVPRSVTKYETAMENECRMEPYTHTVTRYEHQYETRYIPPRLETITKHRLRETEPTCLTIVPPETAAADAGTDDADAPAPSAPVARRPPNRIEATLYFPGEAP